MSDSYIKFFMGDYERDTKALTMIQHGAYFNLLRHVWSTGEGIKDVKAAYRIACAHTQSEKKSVDFVLKNYFFFDGKSFKNERAERLKNERLEKSEKASKSARSRWEKPIEESCDRIYERIANASKTHSKKTCLPEPDPEYIDLSLKLTLGDQPPAGDGEFQKFWDTYPEGKKIAKQKCLALWKKNKLDSQTEKIISSLELWKNSDRWQRGFICDPHKFLFQAYYQAIPDPYKPDIPKQPLQFGHQRQSGSNIVPANERTKGEVML